MNLRLGVLAIGLALFAGCSRPPPAPPPPLQPSSADSNAPVALGTTFAATLRARNDGRASGVVVLSQDAQSLVLGAALDGLAAGTYRLVIIEHADCTTASSASTALRVDFEQFTADAFQQARFSRRHRTDKPLTSFAGQAVLIYPANAESGASPESLDALLACGLLQPLAR